MVRVDIFDSFFIPPHMASSPSPTSMRPRPFSWPLGCGWRPLSLAVHVQGLARARLYLLGENICSELHWMDLNVRLCYMWTWPKTVQGSLKHLHIYSLASSSIKITYLTQDPCSRLRIVFKRDLCIVLLWKWCIKKTNENLRWKNPLIIILHSFFINF